MLLQLRNKRFAIFFALSIKVVVAFVASSAYQIDLFMPFVGYYLQNLTNPWQHFFGNYQPQPFPYPPLMLYLLSPGSGLGSLLHASPIFAAGIFKLPIFGADCLLFWSLIKIFPGRFRPIYLYYFCSPILLYAAYAHSQLDLIPTSLLMFSFLLLIQDRILFSSFIFGLALSTKFHVIAALPLIIIYLYRNRKSMLPHFVVPFVVYLAFSMPFLFTNGYRQMVLNNPEQRLVFSVFVQFAQLKLYLAPMAILAIYIRFSRYSKINKDLLISTTGLLFSVFIFLVPPMPGWYLWVLPFIVATLIQLDTENPVAPALLHLGLALVYLTYFIGFHVLPLPDLLIFGTAPRLKFGDIHTQNLIFTVLESVLLAVIYIMYKFGIHSNSVYKQRQGAFVMGIGGDSGSGKSTLLAQLKSLIPSNSLLELEGDGDHKWERGDKRWQRFTHLDPKANHLHRQSDHILRLKAAKSILRIEYDHSTGHFTQPQVLEAKDYVVICGLHPFYLPKMRRSIDLKIFLETDESLRQHWKVKRDTSNRGYTAEKVIEQLETRMDDSRKYIQPQKEYADLILNYFATVDPTTVPLGDPVPIRLRMTLDSSLQLDGLLDLALHYGFEIEHDYSLDLKTQFLLVSCSEIIAPVQDIAQDLIENLEEIMPLGGNWHTDYRGLVQLIIMMLVSQKRKDWYESGN